MGPAARPCQPTLHTLRKMRLRYSSHTGTKQIVVKLIEYAKAAHPGSAMCANTWPPTNVITSVCVPADVKRRLNSTPGSSSLNMYAAIAFDPNTSHTQVQPVRQPFCSTAQNTRASSASE